MKRLILTSSSGTNLSRTGLADLVITSFFRFAWGPLPCPDELAAFLGPRSKEQGSGYHWSGYVGRWGPDAEERRDLGLAEFCEPYETIELWFDPDPNEQLLLIWLLDYFQAHPKTATKLVLRLVDFDLMMAREEELRRWEVFDVLVTEAELETASMSWQAYRAHLSISKCTKTITVTRGTSAARWRSLNLAKPSSRASGRFQLAQPHSSLAGGTELTNDRLWRWDPERRTLVAP